MMVPQDIKDRLMVNIKAQTLPLVLAVKPHELQRMWQRILDTGGITIRRGTLQ
jgi:hypothetical protein